MSRETGKGWMGISRLEGKYPGEHHQSGWVLVEKRDEDGRETGGGIG